MLLKDWLLKEAQIVIEGYINYNGGGFQFRSTVGDPIVFGETDAEHMRILPDGNVGIGTTSPSAHTLDVSGEHKSWSTVAAPATHLLTLVYVEMVLT